MEKISDKLPKEFICRLKDTLGDKFADYLVSIDKPAVRGVRINTKRISVEEFKNKYNHNLKNIPYSKDGFILDTDEKIGNTPEHLSGLVYLQEPSSMLAVCASGIEKENKPLKILDLCASPGGKTSQIASRVGEDSLIVSNEIISSRANILFSNIERQGFKNIIVLNEKPENLLKFRNYFDYVFVDVPCSGEGMFRKNPETIDEWSLGNVEMCANRQKEILLIAKELVKPQGKLIYSTCTFAEAEDERILEWLTNCGFELLDVPNEIKQSTVASNAKISNPEFARKFYPFSGEGEGQFAAVLKKNTEEEIEFLHKKKHFNSINSIGKSYKKLVDEFIDNNLLNQQSNEVLIVGNNIYLAPKSFDDGLKTILDDLKFVSLGVKIGSIEKDRFEPNHNFFMAYDNLFKYKFELSDVDLKKYLHGEELFIGLNIKGYGVVTKNNYPIGGVKIVGGKLKNLYPKGLRV